MRIIIGHLCFVVRVKTQHFLTQTLRCRSTCHAIQLTLIYTRLLQNNSTEYWHMRRAEWRRLGRLVDDILWCIQWGDAGMMELSLIRSVVIIMPCPSRMAVAKHVRLRFRIYVYLSSRGCVAGGSGLAVTHPRIFLLFFSGYLQRFEHCQLDYATSSVPICNGPRGVAAI
jgi:hypothetical protein